MVADGAAEEAGLKVGDYVLAVNGTDVTGVPHSEAVDLARQGRAGSHTQHLAMFGSSTCWQGLIKALVKSVFIY